MKTLLATLNAKYIHTNLAIRHLKAYCENQFSVDLKEFTIKDPILSIVSEIYQQKPSILGFSCYIWNIEETLKVVAMYKTISPETVIVLGGPEVSYDTDYWLKNHREIDYIIIGEGEESFRQFLEFQSGSRDFKDVAGIAYLKEDSYKLHMLPAKLDLRQSPSPYRDPSDIPHLAKRVTYVETSRGCPFSCQFCLSSIEVGVRYFAREHVKEDIRYLMANGAKVIKFVDRTFNISRSYAMEMFEFLIQEHRPGVVFQFEITADIMRPEVIQYLNDNAPKGLFRFEIGVQSTNDHTNDLVKRRQNFEKLTRTVTMVRDGGKIDQHLDLIAGLPDEDYNSFRKTFNDVFALRPEELQLGFLKLLRGTGLRIDSAIYGYQYVDQAPYEIVGNNVLSFNEIIKIKQVEDILEKYWNSQKFQRTIEYLVTAVFDTPFDFFQQFGSYWESHNWSRIGHQFDDLFKRLNAFLLSVDKMDDHVLTNMKLDFLAHQKFIPRQVWWKETLSPESRSKILHAVIAQRESYNYLVEQQLHERELFKQAFVTELVVDGTLTPIVYFFGQNHHWFTLQPHEIN
ncbi:DUF4080 domain-containing protein [Chryseomicrobium sp. FSL W7-1435]|uniref:B12-binding domain-containing radical SAM protein n=1 Tax=Chryseomicrobium sp. FSL W7-1435 TaxID=2921704 RepID=UPI003159BFBC